MIGPRRQDRLEQSGQDCLDMAAGIGQPGQEEHDSQERTPGQDCLIGLPGENSWDKNVCTQKVDFYLFFILNENQAEESSLYKSFKELFDSVNLLGTVNSGNFVMFFTLFIFFL
jgi:hypothetical protein